MLCFTTSCSQVPDSEPDDRESMIEEVSDLPDAQIKIPAALADEETVENPLSSDDTTQADTLPHGTIDSDNTITYQLDGETRTQLINDLAAEIQSSIDTILADKEYYPNISDIRVNSDCTEFIISMTADEPNLYEASLMMSFYTVGDRYQIYNGVPAENAKTTVIYINEETGAELARTDSASSR